MGERACEKKDSRAQREESVFRAKRETSVSRAQRKSNVSRATRESSTSDARIPSKEEGTTDDERVVGRARTPVERVKPAVFPVESTLIRDASLLVCRQPRLPRRIYRRALLIFPPHQKQDHYAVLGLGQYRYTATEDQIRVARKSVTSSRQPR